MDPLPSDRVSPKIAERAVNALLKWKNSKSKMEKPQLFEQDDFIYLILTLKKIPQPRTNPHKIPLPHALIRQEDGNPSELCLVIDDRPKSNLNKEAALKKIKNDNIPIIKVIKITKLKTDYRPFESKRKLCDSYDMFFADKRVVPLLPKLLGKHFFKKKKIPVPLNLKHANWKEQIEKVCSSALLFLSTGTCCVLKIAKVSMGVDEIVENVMAAINGVAEVVPRKWSNVRSFHLKLLDSLALPLYQSLPDMKLKIDSVKDKEEDIKTNKLEKREAKDVKDDSSKKKLKKKGRIHEVRYMDSNIGELFDEDELGSDDDATDIGEKEHGEDGENDQVDGGEDLGRKRKKVDKVKLEKPAKKAAKVENDGSQTRKMVDEEEAVQVKKQKTRGLSSNKDGEESVLKKEKKKKEVGKRKNAERKLKGKNDKKKVLA